VNVSLVHLEQHQNGIHPDRGYPEHAGRACRGENVGGRL
jgi:hypothetical protein